MSNELHFVQNHGGIPDIDTNAYDILLDRLVNDPKTLILADFQNESLVAIQCSGTRRYKEIVEYSGEGDEMINAPWAEGARGTAKWTSVSLQKDTKYCGGLMRPVHELRHVGAVIQGQGQRGYVGLGDDRQDIAEDPRFPVVGCCFWVYRIKAIEKPSLAPTQSREYLYFQQQTGKHNQASTSKLCHYLMPGMIVDHKAAGVQIQEMPVSSAIMSPWNMSPWNKEVVVQDGEIEVKEQYEKEVASVERSPIWAIIFQSFHVPFTESINVHKLNCLAPSISSLSQEDAVRLVDEEPDYHVKDMYSSIERGHYPTLIMYTQVMDPKEDYPATPVGKLVLNKNPDNHFDFIEQAAFSPSALISVIAPSADIALVYTTSSFYAIDLWTPIRHIRRVDRCVLTGTKVQILIMFAVQAYPSDVEEEDWE
ncbi:hypothetical protein FANTH_1282 [Fusarium anthophilum]|uniref:Catalase core domain-containing protein n=1 Tax=Fusarium anthophilum TaxID=48485 RepID=A0A8H5EBK3_9HYPO|nr:hypothetical protein FANTH_1282 [Fusarium anthophilum]